MYGMLKLLNFSALIKHISFIYYRQRELNSDAFA